MNTETTGVAMPATVETPASAPAAAPKTARRPAAKKTDAWPIPQAAATKDASPKKAAP